VGPTAAKTARSSDVARRVSPDLRPRQTTSFAPTAERHRPVLTESDHDACDRVSDTRRVGSVAILAGAAATLGWLSSGRAVAVPVAVVAVLSLQAAAVDARTLRIPNRLVLAGLAVVAFGVPLVAVADHLPAIDVVGGVGVGWFLSGAPFLLVGWAIWPAGVGGGDWKLLSVQGAAVGLLAPLAAPIILLVAAVGQIGQHFVRRRRHDLPLGPGLAAGYLAAVAVGVMWHALLGGGYT
jgi:leader peptidase (prepilin peptidase) / N-methyltransferase